MTTQPHQKDGHFKSEDSRFRSFISRDTASRFPAEKGRYALYVSTSCPWAHRTMIVRLIKGLDSIIDLYLVHPDMGPEGWYFSGEHGSLPEDPLHGFKKLRDLYHLADPNYSGRYTVPVLWDKKTDTIINNESSEIIRMLATEFDDLLPDHLRESNRPGGGLYPPHLREQIDEINKWVFDTVNLGVYKTGLATTQEAYDENVILLFRSLDRLEALLADNPTRRYLVADHVTEADVRLYTTLVRFDVAYYSIFLCNLRSIRHDYPNLHLWLRRLYWDGQGHADGDGREGDTRGAFFKTTEPYARFYGRAYASARHRVVYQGQGPLIFPVGPAVPVEPLPSGP